MSLGQTVRNTKNNTYSFVVHLFVQSQFEIGMLDLVVFVSRLECDDNTVHEEVIHLHRCQVLGGAVQVQLSVRVAIRKVADSPYEDKNLLLAQLRLETNNVTVLDL